MREPKKIEDYRADRQYLDVQEAELLEAWDALAARVERLRESAASYFDAADWYRRCLEDIQDRRPVRGLGEAKAGYDHAAENLRFVVKGTA